MKLFLTGKISVCKFQSPSLLLSAAAIVLIFHNINADPNVTHVNVLLATVAVFELINACLDSEQKSNVLA